MSRLPELLAAGGAPPRLLEPVAAALGDGAADAAADVLTADPWRLLLVPGVRPDQADAYARQLLRGAARPDDDRRRAALATWLLRRAADDGHTALPAATVVAALEAGPAEAVLAALDADGRAVVREDGLLALRQLAELEETIAEDLAMLAASSPGPVAGLPDAGVSLVVAPAPDARRAHVAALTTVAEAAGLRVARACASGTAERAGVLAAADVAVVEDAEALGLAELRALLEHLDDRSRLVLVGDPALLPPAGPGAPFVDLLAAGIASVELPVPAPARVLDAVRAAVRSGELPPVDDPERSVVVVPTDDAGAVRRTLQLVSDSIPRAVGVPAADVLVVTPRRHGIAGAGALDAALAEAPAAAGARPSVRTVHEAHGLRAPAVVAVLPAESAGSLTRPLVATAFGLAEQHLSVVHACGPVLADAVRRGGERPRRTRLRALVAGSASPAPVGVA